MFVSSNFSVKKLGAIGAVLAIILMSCGGSSTSSNAGKSKNAILAADCFVDQAAKDAAKEAAVEVSPVTTVVTPAKEAYFADDNGNVYTGASTESLGTNDFQDTDGTWIRYKAATDAVTQEVTPGKSLDTVKAEIDAKSVCAPSDANADADADTNADADALNETTTPVLSVRLDQDEVLFLATVTSASTEDIVVSGCGISGESSNQTVGLITSFDAERQTADCTVTVTQGSLTATGDFTYSSQVVTQGDGGDNNNSNVEELPDFAWGTPVFDGVNKWTVEILNQPNGYQTSVWGGSCVILSASLPFVTAYAPDDCTAETFTLFLGAAKTVNDPAIVRTVNLSRTPTKVASDCDTPPLIVGLRVEATCPSATGLTSIVGGVGSLSSKVSEFADWVTEADVYHRCGSGIEPCGPVAHYSNVKKTDLDVTCSAPTYEVNNDDAIVAITTGTCTGDDASLVTEMNVEVAQPCSSSNLAISCIIEGVDRSTLVLKMGTSERVQLQAGTIRFTAKYFGIQDDGEIIFVSDPFQHEIDFQRQCDPVVTADTVEYAKNVRGNIYFEFLSPCKGVTGNLFHFVVPMEDGSTVSLQVAWSPREDGTMLIVNDMGGKISADNAGKTFLAQYAWDGWGGSQTFEFTLPADWRKAKVADPLPTFEARSDDAGNIFGKLGELSAACANYAYNFRIESIDRVDDFKDGPIFDITSENKWASSLPNGVYRVWIYSEDSLNDETPCNAMDQEITVKQAEKPAEPPVIVVVNPIITLPRIDDTNKNDALIVESQVTTINCALNCYDDLISLTGQTEGELFVQVVGSDGETEWIQVDRTRSVNQIPINEKAQKLNVRVFDKQANTFVDGSINLNRIQSANATNVTSGDSNSSNSTRNIIIILAVVLLCGYLAKTLVLDKRKNIQ
jgi:hypothetical protein